MKKLPTSVENFKELIESGYYYVDKTLLIRDIVELSGKIKLITRPRRFGKTLNMDMMLHFFSMDENNNLFENLKIWNERKIVEEHYHKYPVIYISFKSLKELNWQEARRSLIELIAGLAEKYIDLDVSNTTKQKIMELTKREVDFVLYKKSLHLISQALYEERKIPPVILIDEYDVPIESAYLNSYKDPDYYYNMIDFMRTFLISALKGSDTYFSFAVLTGVYRIAKESIFSGLNNLAVFSVFDDEMADKYGFTEEEVVELLKHYDIDTKEDRKMLRQWYGNYKMGKESLYNPWSVICYTSKRIYGNSPEESAQPYWTNTSSNDMIIKQIETNPAVKETIEELLKGEEVIVPLDPWLSLRELEDDPNGVWTLFASSGYISASRIEQDIYSVKIPNRELERFFKRTVMLWLSKLTKTNLPDMYKYLYFVLREGKYIYKFIKKLQDFIINSMSYHDFAKEPEGVYRGFLLGMLSIAQNGYKVESEIESGYGRLDVVIYPKERGYGKYAAIFEVKRADDESKLEEKAKEALQQIKERKYYTKMESLGYKVIGFGIAFCGKKVAMLVDRMDV